MQPVAAPSQPEAALALPPPTATEPWASAQPQTTLAQAPFTRSALAQTAKPQAPPPPPNSLAAGRFRFVLQVLKCACSTAPGRVQHLETESKQAWKRAWGLR